MTKIHFLMNFVMIQLVFEVKLLRIDVNHGPARRSLSRRSEIRLQLLSTADFGPSRRGTALGVQDTVWGQGPDRSATIYLGNINHKNENKLTNSDGKHKTH